MTRRPFPTKQAWADFNVRIEALRANGLLCTDCEMGKAETGGICGSCRVHQEWLAKRAVTSGERSHG
jgi:hypothetical protein